MSTTQTDHIVELDLAAEPEVVLAAIAAPERWWTPEVDRDADTMTVRFGDRHWTRFALDRTATQWTVVDQHESGLDDPREWVGTRVTFAVTPAGTGSGSGSHLRFVHHGLAALHCAQTCFAGWDRYLRGSLKSLVETGAGQPFAGRA